MFGLALDAGDASDRVVQVEDRRLDAGADVEDAPVVLELYGAIRHTTGGGPEPDHAPARLGELQRSVLDVSLAAQELGWRPQRSLGDGLAETWSWVTS